MDLILPGTVYLRLCPLSTDEGKAEASFPLPPKKASKLFARKSFKILRLGKKLDLEQSIVSLLLDREPHSLGVRVVARALKLESQQRNYTRFGTSEKGMSATIDRLATPSEC